MVAGALPFVFGGRGLQAIRPIYDPTGDDDDLPIGFVSAWFGRDAIVDALARLPADVRARVTLSGEELFETDDPRAAGRRGWSRSPTDGSSSRRAAAECRMPRRSPSSSAERSSR